MKFLNIRHATRSDLPNIIDIYNATVPSRMVTADTEPVTVESRIEWFEQHNPNSRPLWVATQSDEICGWISFQSFYGRPAYDATAEISIYIDEQFRHRGLGRTLLQRAITEGPNLGIKTLIGFIFSHNTPSIELFHRLGFETWGRLPRVAQLDDIERDLVIVGKRLLH